MIDPKERTFQVTVELRKTEIDRLKRISAASGLRPEKILQGIIEADVPAHISNSISDMVFERYQMMLQYAQITLDEIPARTRLDQRYWRELHSAAFQTNRRKSRAQYNADLAFMQKEIRSVKDSKMKKRMEAFYQEERLGLPHQDK